MFPVNAFCAEASLAIADAGVQASEDAPFVSTDYQFMPGEYVYSTFQITGFSIDIDQEKESREISLTYSVTVRDSNNIPLAEPISGEIKTHLNSEDKNWAPKRRASFLLPSFVAAGEFYVHIVVKDVLGKSDAVKDVPFRIGGFRAQRSEQIAAQNFRFLREESGAEGLDVAAYRPGDTVYAAFDMTGFVLGPGNSYHLSYGVTVFRPDGKPFLEEANAAELNASSYYPAQFMPGNVSIITTASSPRGAYILVLTVRDLIANRSTVTKRSFSLE